MSYATSPVSWVRKTFQRALESEDAAFEVLGVQRHAAILATAGASDRLTPTPPKGVTRPTRFTRVASAHFATRWCGDADVNVGGPFPALLQQDQRRE